MTSSRFRRGVDLVGVGFGWAILGDAGAGGRYGVGGAGLAPYAGGRVADRFDAHHAGR